MQSLSLSLSEAVTRDRVGLLAELPNILHSCIRRGVVADRLSSVRAGNDRYSDSLRAGRSGDRIPVGARFSSTVQTFPRAHAASSTMGNGVFPGLKWPGRDVDHPPPSSAEVKERIELYLCFPSGPSWSVIG